MSTSSFGKIKEIISDIKDEIDSFQNKLKNISFNNHASNNFNNGYKSTILKNDPSIREIEVNNTSNEHSLSREEKIILFTQQRRARINEIKKQINFLDYIFSSTQDANDPNNDESKWKAAKELLSDKKYQLKEEDVNSLCDAIVSNDKNKKEELLENLVNESQISGEVLEIKNDVILTQDFLSKLKNEGKTISQNFTIKENPENVDSNSWLEEEALDNNTASTNKNQNLNKDDFIDLLSKK